MKRFLKTFVFLIASLFALVSGIDAGLDRLSHSPTQSSFTVYDNRGRAVLAYDGELSACKAFAKPGPVIAPVFLHRT